MSVPGLRRKRHEATTTRAPASAAVEVQALVLEVEVALDPVHDVVVDPALVPQADHRAALRLQQLAAQALVVLGLLLDAVLVDSVEARAEAAAAVVVEPAHALRRLVSHPVLELQLLEARQRGLGRLHPRLRLLALGL